MLRHDTRPPEAHIGSRAFTWRVPHARIVIPHRMMMSRAIGATIRIPYRVINILPPFLTGTRSCLFISTGVPAMTISLASLVLIVPRRLRPDYLRYSLLIPETDAWGVVFLIKVFQKRCH
ncbi:hypothetical protein ASPTUDRAFT_480498 [Aspergillus tubingensis CBS 134.48]|uniref:Uncharacterized protein n=1 Tax=Aspergillus tubingensis (strain CBS 134.48) TaxID=767770 RepID=A0A1L9NBE3_ASPTC|nr:hypothetical protein ASPTUDRAFT_480498 [Aspergillus tubingensis CBS 134.48]